MKALLNPEQELRFTRVAQAIPLLVVVAILGGVTITICATTFYRDINPELPHPSWALLPLILSGLLAQLAYRMARHAYLILTPLGVEVFPLFRPKTGMRVVYWGEIDSIEYDDALTWMTLHFDDQKTCGIHLSLRPIAKPKRELLVHAMCERVATESEKRKNDCGREGVDPP